MDIKKSLFIGMVKAMGISAKLVFVISLLLAGVSCDKGNPVSGGNNIGAGTITDADGNVYHTVRIGNQVWTVENLRTTKYNEGSEIPQVTDDFMWEMCYSLEMGACCYYDNTADADSMRRFGALYNWYAVNSKKLAPSGWHIPTDTEWVILENYLIANGYNWDATKTGNKIAKALAANTDWDTSSGMDQGEISNDLAKNNSSGFSALPGGDRMEDGYFEKTGISGYWWSASESDASSAYCRYLDWDQDDLLGDDNIPKNCGFSVRLVKDN